MNILLWGALHLIILISVFAYNWLYNELSRKSNKQKYSTTENCNENVNKYQIMLTDFNQCWLIVPIRTIFTKFWQFLTNVEKQAGAELC